MRSLLDVNFLIALIQPSHLHSEDAHAWWSVNRTAGWASCPLTQNGFARIMSQPRYSGAVTTRMALQRLQLFTLQTDHAFWPDDLSLLDEQLIDHSRILGPSELTDIYLLALAVKHGGRLATFDRTIPLAAVRGAEARHVAVIG
jgi:uncharacterized protein